MKEFGQLEEVEQVKRLHKILGPHMLRRLKEDVEKSLPKKEEVLVEMNLSAAQKTYYKAVLEREGYCPSSCGLIETKGTSCGGASMCAPSC